MNIQPHDTRPPLHCPPWCTRPPGHDLSDPDQLDRDGALYVLHRALLADVAGLRLEIEQAVILGGTEPAVSAPALVVNGIKEYTAAQARQLADAFTMAARFLASATDR